MKPVPVVSDLWTRPLQVHIFGRDWDVSLSVNVCPTDCVQDHQHLAYDAFSNQNSKVATLSDKVIYNHYRAVCNEYRDLSRMQEIHDPRVPLTKSVKEVFRLAELESIIFPYVRPRPTFEIVCEYTWKEEHGLA